MNTKPINETQALITPAHLRRRAVVYCRVDVRRGDQNTGRAADPKSLAEIARSYGWQDSQIEIVAEALGKSASSAETRAGWQRLQELIDAGQIGAVFVPTNSRLSRHAMDVEIFRLRAALHNTLLYIDGRFIDPAGDCDRILSKLVSMRDSWFAKQRAKAGKRDDAMSRRRSRHSRKLPRSVSGQNVGRRKKT